MSLVMLLNALHVNASENQITPFSLKTCDGETLYAWLILPLPLYSQHDAVLSRRDGGFCSDITATENFRLLRDDPESKLIVYCEHFPLPLGFRNI